MNKKLDLLFVTYPQFHQYVFELIRLLNDEHHTQAFDYVVCVQHGGALMSKIVSEFFKIPVITITTASYRDAQKLQKPEITIPINADITGKKVVVLDEISDTGETLALVQKYLYNTGASSVITATIFCKKKTCFFPTYYLKKDIVSWIIFPYETFETWDSFKEVQKNDSYLRSSIAEYYLSCGLDYQEISQLAEKRR